MGSKERKEREFESRRRLILATAKDLFVRKGFAGVTLDDIASGIEFSKGTDLQPFREQGRDLRHDPPRAPGHPARGAEGSHGDGQGHGRAGLELHEGLRPLLPRAPGAFQAPVLHRHGQRPRPDPRRPAQGDPAPEDRLPPRAAERGQGGRAGGGDRKRPDGRSDQPASCGGRSTGSFIWSNRARSGRTSSTRLIAVAFDVVLAGLEGPSRKLQWRDEHGPIRKMRPVLKGWKRSSRPASSLISRSSRRTTGRWSRWRGKKSSWPEATITSACPSIPRSSRRRVKAVKEFGSSCSGSRFLNGTSILHTSLEEELADFLGVEACLAFTTGYLTNQGVIPTARPEGRLPHLRQGEPRQHRRRGLDRQGPGRPRPPLRDERHGRPRGDPEEGPEGRAEAHRHGRRLQHVRPDREPPRSRPRSPRPTGPGS